MNRQKYFRFLLLSLALLWVITACGNNQGQTTTYTPGCSEQNLIGHINQANSNPGPAIINLDPNCTYTLREVDNTVNMAGLDIHNGLPVITSLITIQGNNAVIEILPDPGEPFFGHIFVDPTGELELYDLTLTDGNRYLGGAVVNDGGDFFASHVTFQDNLAYPADGTTVGKGGAIFSDFGRVRVINDCRFESNMAGQTMATGANQGGAIYSKDGALIVSNTYFFQNHASGDGGAIFAEKTPGNSGEGVIMINDSNFTENSALQNGGGLALINEIEGVFIATTYFRGHNVENYGGAIYSEGSQVHGNHLEFRSNYAGYGGAVFTKRLVDGSVSVYHDVSSLYIVNSASEIGGAIFSVDSDLDLDDTDVEANTANSCGAIRNGGSPNPDWQSGEVGAIAWTPSISRINNSSFRYNEALVGHGGAICHKMGELLVQGTDFWVNVAEDGGGGMFINDQAEIRGSYFLNNSAWNGGAILIGLPLLNKNEVNIYENYTFPDYLTFYTKISSSVFSVNLAGYNGGGIYAHHEGTTLITHSLFQNNVANFLGGGIHRMDGKMFINNSTFSANSANRGGGVMAMNQVSSGLDIKHTTFAFNNATYIGEEDEPENVYIDGGGGGLQAGYHAVVDNSLFYNNSPMDCQITNGSNYSSSETYASDHTCGPLIEPNPKIGPLMTNGGSVKTHALLPDSPLIDILSGCAGLTDDQRGVARPQGTNCDPGSYEFDPENPPVEWPYEEISYTDDSSDNCDPFADTEVSLVLLNVAPGSTDLTLYLKVVGGAEVALPAVQAEDIKDLITARLGTTEANLCNMQGFDDRIYCMFNLPPSVLGTVQDLKFFTPDCQDPVLLLPAVSIPIPQQETPNLVCKESLPLGDCEAAGGRMSTGITTAPKCVCP
jgi:predicted outer membrane repeat protein